MTTSAPVDALLNPCSCNDVLRCRCTVSPDSPTNVPRDKGQGLLALARAAASMDAGRSIRSKRTKRLPQTTSLVSYSSPSLSPPSDSSTKSHKHHHHHHHDTSLSPSPGPSLPPLLLCGDGLPQASSKSVPQFPVIPPLSAIASLAGSGCTCGVECACPGCVEHRGPANVVSSHKNCGEGCGHCVDPSTTNIDLPSRSLLPGPSSTVSSAPADSHLISNVPSSIFDEFIAKAASLPAPPLRRKRKAGEEDTMGLAIPPTDLTMLGVGVGAVDKGAFGFGLVTLPKLECCRGNCGCPPGRCQCGTSCGGCCDDSTDKHEEQGPREAETPLPNEMNQQAIETPPAAPVRSCCAGKALGAAVST